MIYLLAIPHERLSVLAIPFSARTQDLPGAIQYLTQTMTNFLLLSPKNTKKWAIFDILKTIALGVNIVTGQMIPFVLSTLLALSVGAFYFCISRPSKFNSIADPFCIMFWSVNYISTCQRRHFQACQHRYPFSM